MFARTYFGQSCPVCGRPLRIAVELLGRDVVCEHCHGRFTATDPSCAVPHSPNFLEPPLLLIHPDREQLAIMARRFTDLGYHVTPVHHPRQALEAATFKQFRVALVHEPLPEIDGVGLARQLQRRISDVRIIVVVEPNRFATLDANSATDFWCVLETPCTLRRLESSVEEAIHETRVNRIDTGAFQLSRPPAALYDFS